MFLSNKPLSNLPSPWAPLLYKFAVGFLVVLVLAGEMLQAKGATEENFLFKESSEGIEITSYIGSSNMVMIPQMIAGKPVTKLGERSFAWKGSMTSITIPNTVAHIAQEAFLGCMGLTNVTLGEGLITIGFRAFIDCRSLGSIIIPNSVTTIGASAFAYCPGMTNVAIAKSVTTIGHFAFGDCTSLKAITVDSLNPTYSSLDGVLFDKNFTTLIAYAGGKAGSYTIPNSVTSIQASAFVDSKGLTQVTYPVGLRNIGPNAFEGCAGLTSVIIPNTVTTIGGYAFNNCRNLTSAYFLGNAPGEYRTFSDATGSDWTPAIVYYRTGTSNWGPTFGERPTVLWIANADLDEDGMTNEEEMLAGTDPAKANSLIAFEQVPRINDLTEEDKLPVASDKFTLFFQTTPGRSYELQMAEEVVGLWTAVLRMSATTTQKRVVLERSLKSRFYRLLILPLE